MPRIVTVYVQSDDDGNNGFQVGAYEDSPEALLNAAKKALAELGWNFLYE